MKPGAVHRGDLSVEADKAVPRDFEIAGNQERKPLWVRDLPLRPGKQTWLIWHKRRFICRRCSKTFTETCHEIPPRATHTRRVDAYLSARAIEVPTPRSPTRRA